MSAPAGLFPALVAGVFWRRANRWGALAGMLIGRLGVLALASVYPGFPLVTPLWAYLAAAATSPALTTVKTFQRKDGKVWLLPHNEAYDPIDGTHT